MVDQSTDKPGLTKAIEAAKRKLYGRDTAGLHLVGKVDEIVRAAYEPIARAVREQVVQELRDKRTEEGDWGLNTGIGYLDVDR